MNKLIIDGTEYELELCRELYPSLLTKEFPIVDIGNHRYSAKAIPNQPKQKDWEILEAWNAEGHHPYIEKNCKPNGCKIVSVKRLSDNLIFSIDDKFTADAGQELTIKGFEAAGNIMKVFSKEHGYWHLSDIKKVDKPCDEFEILKFLDGIFILGKNPNSTYGEHEYNLHYLLQHNRFKIISIKRHSDGAVFSVGDYLDEMEVGEDIIDGFKLNYNGNAVWVFVDTEKGYGVSLDVAKKAKLTEKQKSDIFNVPLFSYREVTEMYFKAAQVDDKFEINGRFVMGLSNFIKDKLNRDL